MPRPGLRIIHYEKRYAIRRRDPQSSAKGSRDWVEASLCDIHRLDCVERALPSSPGEDSLKSVRQEDQADVRHVEFAAYGQASLLVVRQHWA